MPNTSSAKKALRSSVRKSVYNTARKFKIKNALKDVRQSVAAASENTSEFLSKAFSQLDKAVKSNLIPKGRADRKKSRLSKLVDSVKK